MRHLQVRRTGHLANRVPRLYATLTLLWVDEVMNKRNRRYTGSGDLNSHVTVTETFKFK